MGECHPYYQAKSTSNFDGLDRSCSYLWNGISAVEIFPKRLVYGELACLCNYSIAAFNNGGVGGQKRSALISRIIERYLFIAKRCKVMIQKWILCPVCGSKTRVRIREDTVLENFPLYCPKCKHETLISARQLNISVIKEPNHQRDRNTGSFIGYTGSISVPVVFRYDNSFYSKMIQQKLAANHSYNGHSMAENCKSTWHCVLR